MKKESKESTMAGIAALLVLFTTMLNPIVSSILAVILLFVFAWMSRSPRAKK